MAALCLADEPSVSDETAGLVLKNFVAQCAEEHPGSSQTSWAKASAALADSEWRDRLARALFAAVGEAGPTLQLLSALGLVLSRRGLRTGRPDRSWLAGLIDDLSQDDEYTAVGAALSLMHAAFEHTGHGQVGGVVRPLPLLEELASSLLSALNRGGLHRLSAIWALGWLATQEWTPSEQATDAVLECWSATAPASDERRFARWVLGATSDPRAVPALIEAAETMALGLYGPDRRDPWQALARIGSPQALACLQSQLRVEAGARRQKALAALAGGLPPLAQSLLHGDSQGEVWLDPDATIDERRVLQLSKGLDRPPEEIRALYEDLAPKFGLRLAWT